MDATVMFSLLALLILRSAKRVSKDGPRASWFETARKRLLTMRVVNSGLE
jgi:hypothetical protein